MQMISEILLLYINGAILIVYKYDKNGNMGIILAMQCIAVFYSALQCVAVCCSALQRVAVCCRVLQWWSVPQWLLQHKQYHIMSICVHVCNVLPCIVTHWSALQHVALLCTISSTGRRRLIGCLKLQLIFRKRATNYGALLQKITCKDKASYVSTPPCMTVSTWKSYITEIHHIAKLKFLSISRKIQIEILVWFEFVPKKLSFSIWWILGV